MTIIPLREQIMAKTNVWTGTDKRGVDCAIIIIEDSDDSEQYEALITPTRKLDKNVKCLEKAKNKFWVYPKEGFPASPKIDEVAKNAIRELTAL